MIRAFLFDLDGTLVQTEKLKAQSYGLAAAELSGGRVAIEAVVEAFKDVVGLTRREVSQSLLERFELQDAVHGLGEEPWRAFASVRLRHYGALLDDARVIVEHRWPHTLDLLERARRHSCCVGLATMSHREQALRVLDILELRQVFDVITTVDDVEHGKPHPEIYLLTAQCLDIPPAACLVIEDSPAGVEAAVRAGMHCIAVSTPFTRERLHASELLDRDLIVDEPGRLLEVVDRLMADSGSKARLAKAKSDTDRFKRQAAHAAVELVEPGMVVGLGHGSTVDFATHRLAELFAAGELEGLRCVACSAAVEQLAISLGLPVLGLDEVEHVDLTIDGADEIDRQGNLIKGGGGALLREKLVAQISRREVIIADDSKCSERLGERWPVPIEVVPFAASIEKRRLETLGARVELRQLGGKPFETESGHVILDANFGQIEDPERLSGRISQGAGIVEHGLFVDLASDILVAGFGGVEHRRR